MSELETAKKRAMYLLGGRDYSRRGLYEKLLNNYSEETCEAVAEMMCEYGYIDDARYAGRLAKTYIEGRKYGARRAKIMMRQKGLEDDTIEKALSAYSGGAIEEQLADLIEKKYADRLFLEGLEGKKEQQKVIAALARRGYGYGEIKEAVELVRERLADEE